MLEKKKASFLRRFKSGMPPKYLKTLYNKPCACFLVALTPTHFLYLQITRFKMTGELRYVGEKKKTKTNCKYI